MRSYTNLKTDTAIVSGISAAATTITLAHYWWNYPESNFTVVLSDQDATPNQEVVLIASRSGNTLTVATGGRGWDGTTAAAFDAGDAIECVVVAADFTRLGGFSGARVKNSSVKSSFLTNGAWKTLTWDAEDYDTDGYHDTSTNTDRLTVSEDGYYFISGSVEMSNATNDNAQVAFQILENGSTALVVDGDSTQNDGYGRFSVSTTAYLTAGTYVILQFYQNGGATTDLRTASNATIHRLSSMDGTSFSGASVTRSGDTIGTASVEAIVFSSAADYDTDSYHSTTTNNTRLTAPADGKYLVTASATWDSNATGARIFWLKRDGTTNLGGDQLTGIGDAPQNASAVIDMTAGEYVEAYAYQSSGGDRTITAFFTMSRLHSSGAVKIDDLTDVDTTTTAPTGGELLKFDGSNWKPTSEGGFSGASVYKSTSQTNITASTPTAITFDSEDFDTDGYHDNTTNNTRFTAPEAGYYLITCLVLLTDYSTGWDCYLGWEVDGDSNVTYVERWDATATPTNNRNGTAIIYLDEGSYVEWIVFVAGGSTTDITGTALGTQAQIARLASMDGTSFSGARVRLTADEVIGTGSTVDVDWDEADFDTDTYWEGVTNPERLTVPADGYYYFTANARWDGNATGVRAISLRVNGTDVEFGTEIDGAAGVGDWLGQNTGGPLRLSAGDYVTCRVYQNSGGDLNVDYTTYTDFSVVRLHSSGAVKLDDLTDVDMVTTAPATGDLLRYDGTDWVPATSAFWTADVDDPLTSLTDITSYSGTWSINTYLQCVVATSTACRAFSDTPVGTMALAIVECEFEIPTTFSSSNELICLGLAPTNGSTVMVFGLRGDDKAYFEMDAQTAVTTASYTMPAAGNWVKVRLFSSGHKHTGYIDGVRVLQTNWTDANQIHGADFFPFVKVYSVSSNTVRYRNLKAWSPNGLPS